MDIKELKSKAKLVRRSSIEMVYKAQSGHPGGSLSAADILVALYYNKMKHDPKDPKWKDRDQFVYSKGHDCPAQYAILADLGYFPMEELGSFRQINSLLQGHPDITIPGVEFAAGSLGQGLSYANGIAFAYKLQNKPNKVYCMLGDGETQEGQVWEAAMTAHHHKLDNIIVIVDKNRIQNDDFVKPTKDIDPLAPKWESFGWHVIEIDGHDMEQIVKSLYAAQDTGKPTVIIAATTKGKGVSFMEDNPAFHGAAPDDEQFKQAMEELK